MSLLGRIFGNRYAKDSVVLSSEFIRQKLDAHPLFKGTHIVLKDGDYQGLEIGRLKDFVSDNVWVVTKKYQKEVFDCDDFAACARADILRAGADAGFKRAAFVAEVSYERTGGSYHAANLLIDSTGILHIYEPQTGRITKDLASEIKSVGEVWG